jgi:hypothetical protein
MQKPMQAVVMFTISALWYFHIGLCFDNPLPRSMTFGECFAAQIHDKRHFKRRELMPDSAAMLRYVP